MMRKIGLGLALCALGAMASFAQAPASPNHKSAQHATGSSSGHAAQPPAVSRSDGSVSTEPNLKVAFIGDVGNGSAQRAVLGLIKSEGAQGVLHQGDFDYHGDPVAFWNSVDSVLGANFPYFVSVGN